MATDSGTVACSELGCDAPAGHGELQRDRLPTCTSPASSVPSTDRYTRSVQQGPYESPAPVLEVVQATVIGVSCSAEAGALPADGTRFAATIVSASPTRALFASAPPSFT